MGERRFVELRPLCGQPSNVSGWPIKLTFDCPTCGPPYRIDIPIILNGMGADLHPEVPKWNATTPDVGWDHLTITPSIDNTPSGHGRKKPCSFHGSITDGRVVFP
jgi:hypothetical protein